ncbi:MAG: CcoQ/FixQ family Cbb3-type cytochrome c oxidase assembly chaperone [Halofilum sp. (in: g-proteobacteria)]|nr:CcoQ/FixQ family Cbb3-type cytochrome c oxidase assembly chaperone [Halofilum sp. (in: g-proteobacteria)]
MNDIWGHLIGVFIVVLIVVFVGIWVWAWLPRHRRTFDRMARLPLEGDTEPGEHEHARDHGADTEGKEPR